MKVSVKSDVGLVRETNQDSYCHRVYELGKPLHLCAVADGIGGYQAGEVASRLALEALTEEVGRALGAGQPPEAALGEAMGVANRRIIKQGLTDPTCLGMGTTLTAVIIDGTRLHVGHVGDSRGYVFRHGSLQQITRDHSLVAELVRNGDLTEDEAEHHPQRNVLTQAFGADLRVKADTSSLDLVDGDLLMLCTDGLTRTVPVREIEELLAAAGSLDQACDRLVAAANEHGGFDNITVLLAGPIRLGGEEA